MSVIHKGADWDTMTAACGAESYDLAVSWRSVTCPECLTRKPAEKE